MSQRGSGWRGQSRKRGGTGRETTVVLTGKEVPKEQEGWSPRNVYVQGDERV